VARTIQSTIERSGFNVVRQFCGHGIGRHLFEDPPVPNFSKRKFVGDAPLVLQPGMTFTVEPMVLSGGPDIRVADDGLTIVTTDGHPAAHARHTVAITADGADILTRL
jgi:methionyl aminopeptidase